MKLNKYKVFSLLGTAALLGGLYAAGHHFIFASSATAEEPAVKEDKGSVAVSSAPVTVKMQKPKYVRGIHVTSWVAGSPKLRAALDKLMDETELNTMVIDIKEYEGEVYIPGVKQADELKTYVPAIPDAEKYVAHLKSKGIFPVARIVVFKDNRFPRRKPELGVKDASGNLWKDRKGIVWIDPYSKAGWDYNLEVAERALDLGFEEIQFDYIRFPSDGNINNCRYSQRHSSTTSAAALVDFLKEANRRLKPRGAILSIDVFGLTTTVQHDMGIGQKIVEMSEWVDYVSPMVYPSHYAKGEYRIADPNKAPYRTVYLGLEGAKKRMGQHASKLRPYLQDFSLGYHYGPKEVRDQIQATYDNDIGEWLLWNPRCAYTHAALLTKDAELAYEKKPLPEEMVKHLEARKPAVTAKKSSPNGKHMKLAADVSDSSGTVKANAADLKTTIEKKTTAQ